MARVKTGSTRSRKHKKVLNAAKGYRLARGRHYKAAKETLLHAGQYEYNFSAENLSSGIYFYTLQAGDFTSTKKMILMK